MPEATLADFEALAHKVVSGVFPIMPQPEWGQDAAFVGFIVDGLRAEVDRLRASMSQPQAKREAALVEASKENNDLRLIIRYMMNHGVEWTASNLGEPYHSIIRALREGVVDGGD